MFFFHKSILYVLEAVDVSCNPSSPSSLQPLDAVYLSGLFPLIPPTLITAPYVKMLDDVLLLRDVCLLEFISARLDTIRRCHGCLSLPDPLLFTELNRSAFSFSGPEAQFVPVPLTGCLTFVFYIRMHPFLTCFNCFLIAQHHCK